MKARFLHLATVFALSPCWAANSLSGAFDRCIAARTACVLVAQPCVEVVALPIRTHKVLSRIAGSIIDRICLAIVGAGQPRSTTAVFAAFAGPAFLVLFDSLDLPSLLATIGVHAIDFPGGR